MIKKGLSLLSALSVIINLCLPLNIFAYNDSFYTYIEQYGQAPEHNMYTQKINGTEPNGNEGVVASKIIDFDNDGQYELLILLLKRDYSQNKNALDFIVVENNDGEIEEQSRIRLSDNSSCLNGYRNEDIKIVLKDNYLGYVYKEQPFEGTGYTYKVCSYDGEDINVLTNLYNPGYTSGVALYDVKNCAKEDYYDKGICLFGNEGSDNYGVYNSYDEAIANTMWQCGISTYSPEYDIHNLYFDNCELLCSLEAFGKEDYKNGTMNAISTIVSYSDITKDIKVVLDNDYILFDQKPVMQNDRVMVPLRSVFEALGYAVSWNESTMTAIASKGSEQIFVTIGDLNIKHNNGTYISDTAPTIIADRTLVPVRAIAETAGCNVTWDDDLLTVNITKK